MSGTFIIDTGFLPVTTDTIFKIKAGEFEKKINDHTDQVLDVITRRIRIPHIKMPCSLTEAIRTSLMKGYNMWKRQLVYIYCLVGYVPAMVLLHPCSIPIDGCPTGQH